MKTMKFIKDYGSIKAGETREIDENSALDAFIGGYAVNTSDAPDPIAPSSDAAPETIATNESPETVSEQTAPEGVAASAPETVSADAAPEIKGE